MIRSLSRAVAATITLIMMSLAFSAAASTVLELDLDSLVANSDDIVIGTVTEVESRVEEDGRVYSYIRIAIRETLKGEPGSELVLRQIGGRVDDLATYVPGMPQFVPREEVFLFIERLPRQNIPVVTGLAQGKFSIHVGPDGATRFAVPQVAELRTIRRQTIGKPLPEGLSPGNGLPDQAVLKELRPIRLHETAHELETFKSQVMELVNDTRHETRP
jgi:hypothetical protein